LAWTLNIPCQAAGEPREKGELEMSANIKRKLLAISAALTMSTLAIGAAVGPAHAAGMPVQAAANA
jgi:hypothetical protein